MLRIIQDYKIWKKLRADARHQLRQAESYKYSIAQKMEYPEYIKNAKKLELLFAALPPENAPDFAKAYATGKKRFRGPACFFGIDPTAKISLESFGLLGYTPIFGNQMFKQSILRCCNNNDDGLINESDCQGCPKFDELVKYNVLAATAARTQQQCEVAKQKFLQHFKIFKKTK